LIYFYAQGISKKFVQFNTLLHSKEYDIVAVSETWFDSSVLNSKFIISGYTCFRQDRRIELFDDELYANEARGGVIILVKDDLRPDLVYFDVGAELISCIIRPKVSEPICLCCLYRPEAAGLKCFGRLRKFLYEYDHSNIVIVGDFNFRGIDWLTLE